MQLPDHLDDAYDPVSSPSAPNCKSALVHTCASEMACIRSEDATPSPAPKSPHTPELMCSKDASPTPKPPQSPYRRATPPPYHCMSNHAHTPTSLSTSSSSSTWSEWSDNGEDGEDGSSDGPLPPRDSYPTAQPHPALASHKIFVGGLHPNVDKLILRNHFEAFGVVTSCFVIPYRCFGFVTFHDSTCVLAVLEAGHRRGTSVVQTLQLSNGQPNIIEIRVAVPALSQRRKDKVPRGMSAFADVSYADGGRPLVRHTLGSVAPQLLAMAVGGEAPSLPPSDTARELVTAALASAAQRSPPPFNLSLLRDTMKWLNPHWHLAHTPYRNFLEMCVEFAAEGVMFLSKKDTVISCAPAGFVPGRPQHAPAHAYDGGGEEGACALSVHAAPFPEPSPPSSSADGIMQSWVRTQLHDAIAAGSREEEEVVVDIPTFLRMRVESPWTHTPLFTLSQCCKPPPPESWGKRTELDLGDLLPSNLRYELA